MDIQTEKGFLNALKRLGEGAKPYDVTGTVTRIDGDRIFVLFAGAESETLVDNSTVHVEVGDVVEVSVSRTNTRITGNRTDKAAGEKSVEVIGSQVFIIGSIIKAINSTVSVINSSIEVINSRIRVRDNVLEFLDELETVIASFGERVVIGVKSGCHVIVDKTAAVFMDGDTRLVSIGKSSYSSNPELKFGNGDMTLYEIIRRDSETGAVSSTEFYFNGYGCDRVFVFYGKDSQKIISLSDNGISLPGGHVEDFVVEQGTSGVWRYRKWASGASEAWYTATGFSFAGSSWNGMYFASYQIAYPSGLFVDSPMPTVTASAQVGNGVSWASCYRLSANEADIRVFNSQQSGSAQLQIYACGRWK